MLLAYVVKEPDWDFEVCAMRDLVETYVSLKHPIFQTLKFAECQLSIYSESNLFGQFKFVQYGIWLRWFRTNGWK